MRFLLRSISRSAAGHVKECLPYVDHVCLLFANFLLFGECSNQVKRHVRVQAACGVNDNADYNIVNQVCYLLDGMLE
jgi:hypothetical protein